MHSRRQRRFSDSDVSLLVHVSTLMAGAVENSRLYSRLAEREDQLERFARHTLELQETEHKLLAAEIHDGISQPIVSLYYHLSAAADTEPALSPEAFSQLSAARDLAGAALEEARAVIGGLHPPSLDDLGLGACLRGLVRDLPPGLRGEAVVDPCVLDPHVETAIYRMAQEGLQNVVKHAAAENVFVELRERVDAVQMVIEDDGVGMYPEVAQGLRREGYGLAGMRARANLLGASLAVRSSPGQGTRLTITVPHAKVKGPQRS